jgi:ribose 5-phosphate isomerase B
MKTAKPIYLGSDHAGFNLKEKIKHWLGKHSIVYEDLGSIIFDPSDDYPDYAERVARKVVRNKSLGILFCGSAQGMCISANKIKGVRAVIPYSLKEARLSREHNDANIICLSGWYVHFHQATRIIGKFLITLPSKEPRHLRRINKIKKIEKWLR